MANDTPTRVPFKAARGHVPLFWPLLRCAVALGALLGIVSRVHINGMAAMRTRNGFWFTAAEGGIFNYGPRCRGVPRVTTSEARWSP